MLKNILITTENYYPIGGGTEQFIRWCAEFLTSKNFNVHIYTRNIPEYKLNGEVKSQEGIIDYSDKMEGSMVEPFLVIKNKGFFSKYIKDKKIDMVFANNHNSLAWILASKMAKVPVVYGCHGVGLMDPLKRRFLMPNDEICWGFPGIIHAWKWLLLENSNSRKKLLLRLLFLIPLPLISKNKIKNYWKYKKALKILNSADARYGNSSMTATLFGNDKNTYGFPLAINASNPNMSNHFKPEIDETFLKGYGLEPKKYILCTSRINYIKGQKYLVEAMKYVNDKSLKLVLVGNSAMFSGEKFAYSPYIEDIKKIIKKNSLKKNIVFTGLVCFQDIKKIYSGALIYVLPSIWLETFGYVTLESMACETPVIVTDSCGSKECLDENTGFIIDRKNSVQIADIINDKNNDFIKMGKMARKKVLDTYDWKACGDNYIKIFKEVSKK